MERRLTDVYIVDGLVAALGDDERVVKQALGLDPGEFSLVDASSCYVLPGLIDLQVNGGPACNLWEAPTDEDFSELRRFLLEAGVTSFLPTLISDHLEAIEKNIKFLKSQGAGNVDQLGACVTLPRMPAIHLEGPCLSAKRPGVHPREWIVPPSIEVFEKIVVDSVGLVTMASELDPTGACLDWLAKHDVLVSLGHSNATFEQAQQAFSRGVKLITHLFNAMPPLHHRDPGLAGAALLDKRVSCCLIADGLHLSPAVVDLVYRLKGADKTILVTDIAHIGTTGGELVGSSITLDMAVRNIVDWNIADLLKAVRMASFNPAEILGLGDRLGLIAPGYLADLVLWDKKTLALKTVVLSGRVVHGSETTAVSSVS